MFLWFAGGCFVVCCRLFSCSIVGLVGCSLFVVLFVVFVFLTFFSLCVVMPVVVLL